MVARAGGALRGCSDRDLTAVNERPDDDEEESDSERRTTNLVLLGAAVIVVVGGVWLVNALIDARKSEECMESGRRNCNPISVPARDRDQ